jgi:hypothetical protein
VRIAADFLGAVMRAALLEVSQLPDIARLNATLQFLNAGIPRGWPVDHQLRAGGFVARTMRFACSSVALIGFSLMT